ncbi:hypothetical protein FRC07_009500 [Ceratobasidium sp. 392]|nr:hypothetical protein FRC07_009500 [Ceratobasidium sp. 392]
MMPKPTKTLPVNAEFSSGGDLTLRSLDGVEFSIHSVILSLASPVLAHMFNTGIHQKIIDVAETSEMLAFMLHSIYPRSPPPVLSLEILGKGLHLANKYQLKGMRYRLRKELSLKGSPISVFADPLGALAFATVHDLPDEAALAASVASKSYDFCKTENLVKLAKTMPSIAPVVKMIGVPSARTLILVEVLFEFHKKPMLLSQPECFQFLCGKCDKKYFDKAQYGAPEWQARWAYWVFQELKSRSISESDKVFTLEFFKGAMYKGEISLQGDVCGCHVRIYNFKRHFETWTAGVREYLVMRLKALDPLDALA